jgi:predicted nucleic acid-binding protein
MTYLIDSDYLIDALIGRPAALATLDLLTEQGTAISIISLGEVFEGAYSDPDPAERVARMRRVLGRFRILSLTEPVMERFARIRAYLRRAGQLIPDLDLLIAATSIHHGLQLVTRNLRHFGRIPGPSLYHATS